MTQNSSANGRQLKIVIVGDGGCGKTSLLMVYAKGDFPETYAPSVFEKYMTTVKHGGKEVQLNLYDTAGQDDYDRLRPLSYQDANLILVCYDVTSPTSYENVLIKGEETQRQMNATLYLECSAKHRENVEDVFKEATKLALEHSRKSRHARKKRRRCHLM
ncbi:Rho-related GTP-binding protein RhoF [Bagarius yarrelli]|uniref:Rho-related GTP-binding protein RhoF n=1 Tax=Bagarius yarrelli TaxID=175774 RepID=A0A556U2V5_BAGYA|nr:Rho-related GTP-binding protein RhoF [Bagarius yarrelli]